MKTKGMSMAKARVRPHIRRMKTGKVVTVKQYTTKQMASRYANRASFSSFRSTLTYRTTDALSPIVRGKIRKGVAPSRILAFDCVTDSYYGKNGYAVVLKDGDTVKYKNAIERVINEFSFDTKVEVEHGDGLIMFLVWKNKTPHSERSVFARAMDRFDAFIKGKWLAITNLTAKSVEVAVERMPEQVIEQAHQEPAVIVKALQVQERIRQEIESIELRLNVDVPDGQKDELLKAHLDLMQKSLALQAHIEEVSSKKQ